MNEKSSFRPAAFGTPADSWTSRLNPLAAAWHWSATRQGGSAWRAALIESAEAVTAQTLRPEAKT